MVAVLNCGAMDRRIRNRRDPTREPTRDSASPSGLSVQPAFRMPSSRSLRLIIAVAASLLATPIADALGQGQRLLRQPDVGGDRVVFTYDLG
jgi:hypothetical protein